MDSFAMCFVAVRTVQTSLLVVDIYLISLFSSPNLIPVRVTASHHPGRGIIPSTGPDFTGALQKATTIPFSRNQRTGTPPPPEQRARAGLDSWSLAPIPATSKDPWVVTLEDFAPSPKGPTWLLDPSI